MGSTFVRFHGQGFEASDTALEVWLSLLVQEIDRLDNPSTWLQEIRDEWHLQSTAGFGFGVMPGLDHFITNDEKRDIILDLCVKALARLERYGNVISQTELNSLGTGGEGAVFTEDVPAEMFVRTAHYFIKLLQSRLGPDEMDARFEPDAPNK